MHSRDQRLRATHPDSRRLLRARSPPPENRTIGTGSTRLVARPATIKTQRQSTRLALRLDRDAEERLGGGLVSKTNFKTSKVQRRVCKSTTLLIAQVAWTPPM